MRAGITYDTIKCTDWKYRLSQDFMNPNKPRPMVPFVGVDCAAREIFEQGYTRLKITLEAVR